MARFTKKKLIAGTMAMFILCAAGGALLTGPPAVQVLARRTTGTSAAITAVQTSVVTDMRPAGAAQSLDGTFRTRTMALST